MRFFLLLVLFLLNFRDKRANLLHSLCIFQWRVILEGSFKITLNVIIWSQVSKTLITFERMCLNDLHWTYIQFILHTQRARKTFSGRNTMYALIQYSVTTPRKVNPSLLEKTLIFFCQVHNRSITIFTFLIWPLLGALRIKLPANINTYHA